MKSLIGALMCLLVFVACKNEKKISPKIKIAKELHETWQGKKLMAKDSLLYYGKKDIRGKKNYKITAFYDGDCSACYAQLDQWKAFKKEVEEEGLSIAFDFVLHGNSSAVIESQLESIEISLLNSYYDLENNFANVYPFLEDYGYVFTSILTNKNGEILFIGNPIISKSDKKRILELIQ